MSNPFRYPVPAETVRVQTEEKRSRFITTIARTGSSEEAQSHFNRLNEFYRERDVVMEERRMRYESSPIGRMIEPEEVAELVHYLASDAAAAVTGQTVNICGGQTMD